MMSFAAPAHSTSSEPRRQHAWRSAIGVIAATVVMLGRTRIIGTGVVAYSLSWLSVPLMDMLLTALIYRDNTDLRNYAIIASSGVALLFGLTHNGGEILDSARRRGVLGNLFLAPVPRYVWLGGFQVYAFLESLLNAMIAVGVGVWLFDIELRVNVPSLVLTILLLTTAMWGASLALASIGLYTRNANFLSNLLFPLLTLVSGTMFPVDLAPDWVRIPARFLPFAYGNEALVQSLTNDATIVDLANKLLPLAGFALLLPLLGILLFGRTERAVRAWGTLELV